MQADRTKEITRGFEGRQKFARARKAYEAWKAHYFSGISDKKVDEERQKIYADLMERTHARWDEIARAKVVALMTGGKNEQV